MALTFGQMTDLILAETYRDASFSIAVQNAIVSAIKELEIEQIFINQRFAKLTLEAGKNSALLPVDFISALQLSLVYPQNDDNGSVTILNQSTGFTECTFYELQTYIFQLYTPCTPGRWALEGNSIWVDRLADQDYYIRLWYYARDGQYPANYPPADTYNYTSIWLGDFTQDVTRYKARGIFYRDSLQSPEMAASEFQKADQALSLLRLRNSQRSTINTLSM